MRLVVFLTSAEERILGRAARAADLTPSGWCRAIIREALRESAQLLDATRDPDAPANPPPPALTLIDGGGE